MTCGTWRPYWQIFCRLGILPPCTFRQTDHRWRTRYMNSDFPRILTLLRRERGISQKQAATELGISQALLSHYERGIRECGLDFVVKASRYYDVSCDSLLGCSPERNGTMLQMQDLPEPEQGGKGNMTKGNMSSILPMLNKKLIQPIDGECS